MLRFLALTWSPSAAAAAEELRQRVETGAPDWTIACTTSGLAAWTTDVSCALPTAARGDRVGAGVVFGALFDRTNRPIGALDDDAADAAIASRGARLIERFWGSWIAILRGPEDAIALRAPGGSLRCFHLRRRDVDIWCSDIEDATALLHSSLVTNATGLEGVAEVLGGQRLTAGPDGFAWDWPWRPADAWRTGRIEDADQAADVLRDAVQETVEAWAGRYGRIVHRLSGGLDSSIVLGCLAHTRSRPEVVALTYFMPPDVFGSTAAPASRAGAVSGDERFYARLAAAAVVVRLLERERRSEHVDLRALLTAHRTARPSWLAFSPDLDRIDAAIARELGADAFFTGRGGDGVFYASVRPWPAIDAAWERRLGPRFFSLILEAGWRGRRSAWSALGLALTQGLLRRAPPPARPPPLLERLLDPEAVAHVGDAAARPPWTALCAGLPPGKREQVHAFFSGHHYAEPFERGRVADVIDPLQSQPVFEACLRVPTAILLEGGSRGLARRAFADRLPEAIRLRTSKAAGDAFIALVVRRNAGFVRDLLLGGVLADLGLLDGHAIEGALAAQEVRGEHGGALLHLAGVEAWARGWSGGGCAP